MPAPGELSFLPDDYLQRKARRRAALIFGGLLLAVAGGIGSAYFLASDGASLLEEERQQIDAQYREEAQNLRIMHDMQDKQRIMSHQAQLTASLLEKAPRSYILAQVTNSLPAGVSLTEFILESKVKNPPPAQLAPNPNSPRKPDPAPAEQTIKEYDVSMRLSGLANSDFQVAAFLKQLGKTGLFTDVNLLFTEEYTQPSDQGKLRKFSIEMNLNNQVDLQTPAAAPSVADSDVQEKP